MFIDAHAHLNDDRLYANASDVIKRAKENGVEIIINAGSDLISSTRAVELAEKFPECYAVIGVHPENPQDYNDEMESFLLNQKDNPKVLAIGEIGLDYHYEGYDKNLQKEVFLKQLILADKMSLPIVIHSRDATGDMLQMLKDNKHLLKNRGLLHCFSGSQETLNEVLKLGFIVSFGGVVTFKNSKNAGELLKNISLDDFILETDCPYLCPEPYRGQTNEPKYIPIIAQKISEIIGVNIQKIQEKTTKNVKKLFKRLK